MVMKLSEISNNYGIPLSTLNSAVKANAFPVIGDNPKQVDTDSTKFQTWLNARNDQSRVKGEILKMENLAEYSLDYKVKRGTDYSRYSESLPIKILFFILQEQFDDSFHAKRGATEIVRLAKEKSIREIADLTKVTTEVAKGYVELFYENIGETNITKNVLSKFLKREAGFEAAYLLSQYMVLEKRRSGRQGY